jgi:hypothetical protein
MENNRDIKEVCAEEANKDKPVFDLGKIMLMSAQAPAADSCKDQALAKILPGMTLDRLADSDKSTLNSIYKNSTAGDIPEGDTTGKAIFLPGTKAGELFSTIGDELWKGKVFEQNGDLVNKILGHNFVHADVHKGTSWFDGKESIIIDYKGKSLATSWIRDEIREVKPGLYLGKMYARLPFGDRADVLFFALESNKKS